MCNALGASALLFTSACEQQASGAPPATPVAASAGPTAAGSPVGPTTAPVASTEADRPAANGGAAGAAGQGSAATARSGASPSGAAGSADTAPDVAASGMAGAMASAGSPAAGSGEVTEAAGAGAEGATGGAAADPLMPDWSMRMDEGKGDGNDVVTIGDSWMDYVGGGGGIEAGLDRAGTNYRHFGLSATTLLSGQIPSQYTQAKNIDPNILTVIMTGGGNDIMFSGGCNTAEACEESVAAIQAGLDELWTEMAADGVKDVIYIQYSADAGTAPRETRPKETKPVPICLTGKINCHVLPTTELVMGELVDGIHPTYAANDRIAAALLEMMETRKMRR